jgi:quercetin dioxygenase-like cupin family protein
VHEHPGIEVMYVISGKAGSRPGRKRRELGAGDSISFDSGVAHGYHRVGKRATAIVSRPKYRQASSGRSDVERATRNRRLGQNYTT